MSLLLDKSSTERQLKKAESKKDRAVSDIKFLLRFSEFRRFCKRLLDQGDIFNDSENYNDFRLGKRSMAVSLYKLIKEAKPDALMQIDMEHESEIISEKLIEEQQQSKEKEGGLL